MLRMRRTERASARRSSGSEKYSGKIRGCAIGSLLQQDAAAAKGTAGADHNREAMTLGEKIGAAAPDPAARYQRRRHDDDRVGDRERRIAAHVSVSCDITFAERAAARYRIPQSDPERRPRVEVFVSGHWLRAGKAQRVRRVVLKVAADFRRIDHNWNLEVREVIGWPDTRQHQKLRRVDGAPAQDDLALRPDRLAYPIFNDLDAGALECLQLRCARRQSSTAISNFRAAGSVAHKQPRCSRGGR